MFGLGRHGPDGKYAVILDIGSASVGAAIVASDVVTEEHPIIFTHREWAVIKDASVENPTRFVEEAILRMFLVLSSKGLSALNDYDPGAIVSHIQVAISAPWAHTITQQAEYSDETPFKVTEHLIDSLLETAKKQSIDSLETTEFLQREGLEVITNQTLHMAANGYSVTDPRGQEVTKVYVAHSSGLASKKIVDTIRKHQEEVFPDARLWLNTFMLAFYSNIREIFPTISDYCLVDITGEATEVGVVRNNELTKVSHSLIGMQTLIRMLKTKLKFPEGTARTLFLNDSIELTQKQKIVFESVLEEYVEELITIFKSVGDSLTIPKNIYLHTDKFTETFFKTHVTKAANRATHGTHNVVPITSGLFEGENTSDTAILLSSHLFHTLHKHGTLAQD